MPAKTPTRIAEKVLTLWLLGLTREEINQKVGTSVGNIMHIVKEAKKNIPDIILLRKTAVWIRKYGWKQDVFSSAIRHRNIMYSRGLTDEQIDDLIELVDEHCFKREISVGSFIATLKDTSIASRKYGCSIEGLDKLISEKESLVLEWEDKGTSAEFEYYDTLQRYGLAHKELIQYRKDLPLVNTIKLLRQRVRELEESIGILNGDTVTWDMITRDISLENVGLTIDEANKAIQLLIDDPSSYEKEIKSILAK